MANRIKLPEPKPPTDVDLDVPKIKSLKPPALTEFPGPVPSIPGPSVIPFDPTSMLNLMKNAVPDPQNTSEEITGTATMAQMTAGLQAMQPMMDQITLVMTAVGGLAVVVKGLAGLVGGLPGLPTLKLPVLPSSMFPAPSIPSMKIGDEEFEFGSMEDPFSAAALEKNAGLVPPPDPQEIFEDVLNLAGEQLQEAQLKIKVKWILAIKINNKQKSWSDEAKDDLDRIKQITVKVNPEKPYGRNVGTERSEVVYAPLPNTKIVVYKFYMGSLVKKSEILNEIEEKIIKGRYREIFNFYDNGVEQEKDD